MVDFVNKKTLIVTNAGGYEIDPNSIDSFQNLNYQYFDEIYFVVRSGATFFGECVENENFELINVLLKHKYNRDINVVSIDKTKCQVETVYNIVKKYNIQGSVFIKDSDNTFTTKVFPVNCICVYPIEKLQFLSPMDKSYVSINSDFFVTNIIEKKVVDHYINVGGVGFANIEDFCDCYEKVVKICDNRKLYMSNVIQYMLLNDYTFNPNFVEDFCDFSTKKVW